MSKRWRIINISILSVVIIGGLSMYYSLGGFNELTIQQNRNSTYFISGVKFKGKMSEPAFAHLFDSMEVIIKNSRKPLTLAAYYTSAPTSKNENYVEAWIGGISKDSTITLPELTQQKIYFEKSLYGFQKAHFLVNNVYAQLEKEIEAKKLPIDRSKVIEFYPNKNEIGIELKLSK